jgi:tetratricopeptide (TPR) repeat protein
VRLNEEDRINRAPKSDSRAFLSAVLAITVTAGAALVAIPELRDDAKRLIFAAGDAIGIKPPQDEYAAAYQRLGISSLSGALLASAKVSSNLAVLAREPCDKTAIFGFGEALVNAREGRMAAEAYFAFAAACPNAEGEQNRAAQILFQLGDSEKVVAITDVLIAKNPTVAPYRYLRGKALANMKRYAEAIEDYKSTIELQKNTRDIGDWVFVEMANIYAAMGRPCDAAATILAWVAIDPSVRNTLNARKMVEEYSAQDCARDAGSAELKKL